MLIMARPQLGKGALEAGYAMANAGASLDGGDAQQESKYGALFAAGLGLEGLSGVG